MFLSRLPLVTLVAIHAVVHIAADIRVMEIGCVPAAMTIGALEDRVVALVLVAGSANPISVAMIHREECVILRGQGRRYPCHRGYGVTGITRSGPSRRLMIGVCGAVVGRHVATGTD